MERIQFYCSDLDYKLLRKGIVRQWINDAIIREGKELDNLSIIFCSDNFLLDLNLTYLNHDTLTDILTFDLSQKRNLIQGEIYISIERIRENAQLLGVTFKQELNRVMIHGVLHLCGYKDKSKRQKTEMTIKEDFYLSLLEISL
jgi:rRNA maturation RNase YbeY